MDIANAQKIRQPMMEMGILKEIMVQFVELPLNGDFQMLFILPLIE